MGTGVRLSTSTQTGALRREIIGGATTFATMSYIVVVNPGILSDAMGGEWFGPLVVATCISAAIATALMGWWANYPIALAPGMGLNAYFAYSVVLRDQIPWPVALAAVLISGLLFIALTFANVQETIVSAIPPAIRHGTAAGIGIFIAFIGLRNAGVIVENPATFVAAGDFTSAGVILTILGIVLIGALRARRVPGDMLIGIAVLALVGVLFGITPPPEHIVALPTWPSGLAGQPILHLPEAFELGILTIVATFLFVDLFDTTGTLTGIGAAAGLVDEAGRLPRARQAFLADGVGTSVGALMGTSTVTSYVESAAGISAGARTGMANYATAALFLLAIPFYPLAQAVPAFATAPALVIVGVMMCGQMRHVDWNDTAQALPAVVVMIGIPLTYSIADGLALAFVVHPLLMLAAGRRADVHWFGWVLGALVVARYAFLQA